MDLQSENEDDGPRSSYSLRHGLIFQGLSFPICRVVAVLTPASSCEDLGVRAHPGMLSVVVMKVSLGTPHSGGQVKSDKGRRGEEASQGNGRGRGQEAALGLSSLAFEVSPQLTFLVWACMVCGPGADKKAGQSAVRATNSSVGGGGDGMGPVSR